MQIAEIGRNIERDEWTSSHRQWRNGVGLLVINQHNWTKYGRRERAPIEIIREQLIAGPLTWKTDNSCYLINCWIYWMTHRLFKEITNNKVWERESSFIIPMRPIWAQSQICHLHLSFSIVYSDCSARTKVSYFFAINTIADKLEITSLLYGKYCVQT